MAYGLAGAYREELNSCCRAHGTAQLPSKRIRVQQDRPKYACYSKEHQEEQPTCPNLQSLQRFCPLPPGSACMIEYLIAARAAIILWTSLAVMPAEIVFDAIEAELERRDVER
jgi:hypothetical protein